MPPRHATKRLGQELRRWSRKGWGEPFSHAKDLLGQPPNSDTPDDRASKSTPEPSTSNPPRRHRPQPSWRVFNANTLVTGTKKRSPPQETQQIRGSRLPGTTSPHRQALRGNPKDFPGERVFLFPASWACSGGKDTWLKTCNIVRGPSEKKPLRPRRICFRPNSMNFVQVASTPTADTGGNLILHFDHRRYLFGQISEGTQRALNQRKFALAKMEMMFLSGSTRWDNTGGMIGMMLSVADVLDGSRRESEALRQRLGKPKQAPKGPERIEIHGPKNLTYSIATSRTFIFRKGLPIRPIEYEKDVRRAYPSASYPDWEDDSIQVWKVPIHEPSEHSTSRKRSHEVMTAEDEVVAGSGEAVAAGDEAMTVDDGSRLSPEKREKINREATSAVVEEMFNSSWSKDTLYETKLHDVSLPATIFVRKNGQLHKYKGPLPNSGQDVPNIDVLVRHPWPAVRVKQLPHPTSESDMSLCYIVKNRGRRGKFNPQAAKQLGVQVVDFKRLTAGETVKGKDDIDVTPDMVIGERMKPNGFALMNLRNTSCVESFLARPEWKNSTVMEHAHVYFWILGPSVIDDPRIQSFMKERPNVKHLVMGRDTSPNMLAMDSYALMSTKLRRIDPDRFPILNFDNTCRDLSFIGPNVETARVGMKAMLSSGFSMKDDEIVPFPTFKEVSRMDNEILSLADKAAAKIQDPEFIAEVEQLERDIPNRDAEIIPLGTGSALPSKYRNVSSTLIRIPQYGNYILDCGENTIGQMRRAFGEETSSILQSLRCIFISHMHADHHLGIVSVINAWAKETAHHDPQPKLTVACPIDMKNFLFEYLKIEPGVFDRILFEMNTSEKVKHVGGSLLANHPSGLSSLVMVPVDHCRHSYAGVLAWPSGLKIAYSGDCRPSDNLVEIGKGATLLIHESTFDDDKQGDAIAKKHSTMAEALDVADRMGARRVLLTHFSQRYAKIPIFDKRRTSSGADQAVLLAFDQMRVKLGEFRHAQAFLPAIKRMFDIEAVEEQEADGEPAETGGKKARADAKKVAGGKKGNNKAERK